MIGYTFSVNGRMARKDIVRRLIVNAQNTAEENVENGHNWCDERDSEFATLRTIAKDYGMAVDHVFAIAEHLSA